MTEFPYTERPDWDAWALGLAHAVGPGPTGRADCTRRKVGAVIVEPHRHRVIGLGYNGTEPGGPSCLKGECPRGRHFRRQEPYFQRCPWDEAHNGPWRPGDHSFCSECIFDFLCACGKEWPCEDAVPPGSSYDTGPGVCINGHAEQNAQANVTMPEWMRGATMYVTEEPCGGCVRQIRTTTEIVAIIWPDGRIDFERPGLAGRAA